MAFLTVTGNLKDSILAFLKRQVGQTLYRAFSIILDRCCNLSVKSIDVECVDTGEYDITIVTNEAIAFLGKGTAQVVVNDVVFGTGTITEPNTITFESVLIAAGSYDVSVTVFLPTNSDETIGVYKVIPTEESVTFSAC